MRFKHNRLNTMRIGATLCVLALACTAAHAETLAYRTRAGMDVTVVKKSNIGTTHAKILTRHTRANATAYCRDYVGKVTARCIADELKVKLLPEISANCKTGQFITLYGQGYRFLGANPDYDADGDTAEYTQYRIVEAGGGEPLKGYSATGYDVALGQFEALCPNRAR
ncbi:hypothetical protein [Nitrobacter sp. 62-13]|uniref:hypothetical protein n=1 Tax=Nitrobacter sp. 62-13 TaxID=1895797 RepID=UPI0025D66053|nr:hypothetical protein [Nitrobacter sp. 62-13]